MKGMGTQLSFLDKFIPMMLTAVITSYIFSKVDNRYKVINRLTSKLNIKREWQPFFIVASALLIIFVIGLFGMYVVDIPNRVFYMLTGVPLGAVMFVSDKLNPKKK